MSKDIYVITEQHSGVIQKDRFICIDSLFWLCYTFH